MVYEMSAGWYIHNSISKNYFSTYDKRFIVAFIVVQPIAKIYNEFRLKMFQNFKFYFKCGLINFDHTVYTLYTKTLVK